MDVRFDRADRLIEDLGDLGVAPAFDEAQRSLRRADASEAEQSLFDQDHIGRRSTICSGWSGPSWVS